MITKHGKKVFTRAAFPDKEETQGRPGELKKPLKKLF
jgi:hypothetical protein